MRTGKTFNQFCVKVLSATAASRRIVSSSSAEGASGFCRTMPPSERQLMSIGASEHRAFVRAKARFAGQKAQEHILSVEMPFLPDIALPDVPASDLPAPGGTPPARPYAVPTPARCEPFPAFLLLPRPSTCPAELSAAFTSARCGQFPPNRLIPASRAGSWPGAMAADARKQAASCSTQKHRGRLPAPVAPLKRGIIGNCSAPTPRRKRNRRHKVMW